MRDSSPAWHAIFWPATGWLVLIFITPVLQIGESQATPWVYRFFGPICHQLVDRSFLLLGVPLPVCARCLGLYSGFWIGLLALPRFRYLTRLLDRYPRLFCAFSIPLLIDLITQNTHWTRFASGLIATIPFPYFVYKAVEPVVSTFRKQLKGTS